MQRAKFHVIGQAERTALDAMNGIGCVDDVEHRKSIGINAQTNPASLAPLRFDEVCVTQFVDHFAQVGRVHLRGGRDFRNRRFVTEAVGQMGDGAEGVIGCLRKQGQPLGNR